MIEPNICLKSKHINDADTTPTAPCGKYSPQTSTEGLFSCQMTEAKQKHLKLQHSLIRMNDRLEEILTNEQTSIEIQMITSRILEESNKSLKFSIDSYKIYSLTKFDDTLYADDTSGCSALIALILQDDESVRNAKTILHFFEHICRLLSKKFGDLNKEITKSKQITKA